MKTKKFTLSNLCDGGILNSICWKWKIKKASVIKQKPLNRKIVLSRIIYKMVVRYKCI